MGHRLLPPGSGRQASWPIVAEGVVFGVLAIFAALMILSLGCKAPERDKAQEDLCAGCP